MSSPLRTPPYEDAFSAEETDILERDGLFLKPIAGGKRKVSASVLSPPYSHGSFSSSTTSSGSSTASVRRKNYISSKLGSFTLPSSAISPVALEFIGFTPEAANEIYTSWVSRPDPDINPDELIDYARSHVQCIDPREDLPEYESMTKMGLSQDLQNAIMNPQYTHIRLTNSLYFWVEDTLRIEYATLLGLQAQLRSAADRVRGTKKPKRGSMPHVGTLFPGTEASSSQAQPPQYPETTATVSMTSEWRNLPEAWVSIESHSPPALPDHYILYKGKAASEMDNWTREDGSLEMLALSTYSGGDFNCSSLAWYWTLEEETAEIYRAWAALRCKHSETWMIQIQVPKSFIGSLRKEELWYSRDWKEFVWYCKKRMQPPERYNSYWQETELMIGHICSAMTTKITRMKANEVQEKLDSSCVLMLPSNPSVKATQWVFMQLQSVNRLGQEIRGKIHIEISAPVMSTDDEDK